MARLTKRSYNRKLVMLGVMLFIGIGLISTGFAAWVMSTDAEKPGNGNVTGATIADSSMTITLDKADNLGTITFGAEPGDRVGRIRGDGSDDASLKITITGTVTNHTYMQHLYVNIELPVGVQNAIEQGYLKPVACATADTVDLKAIEQTETNFFNSKTGKFSYVIELKWGEKFSNVNPSLHYDLDAIANSAHETYVDDATMKQQMHAFRVLLNGGTEINDTDPLPLTYKVIVKALAN